MRKVTYKAIALALSLFFLLWGTGLTYYTVTCNPQQSAGACCAPVEKTNCCTELCSSSTNCCSFEYHKLDFDNYVAEKTLRSKSVSGPVLDLSIEPSSDNRIQFEHAKSLKAQPPLLVIVTSFYIFSHRFLI